MLVSPATSSMGDQSQIDLARRHRDEFRGPILEIGSRDYGSTPNLRPLFPGDEYVGVDLLAGAGVDHVIDLTEDFEAIDAVLGNRRFGTVFCLSVLEHCKDPFAMCRNIERLLAPGGAVYVSVPFAWEFHGYPSDYWRFTPEAIKVLFPGLEFPPELSNIHTSRAGDVRAVDSDLGRILLSTRRAREERRYGRMLCILLFRLLRAIGIGRWLLGYRQVFPPVMIDMIGRASP